MQLTASSRRVFDGLLSDRVYNFWRQTNGVWWFCTSRGVSRYDPKKAGQGTNAFQNFTSRDGLVAGNEAGDVLGINATIDVRDQFERQVVHPWITVAQSR